MNHKVVAIAGSLAGLAVGSVGGFLFAKKQMEEALKESIDTINDLLTDHARDQDIKFGLLSEIEKLKTDKEFSDRQNKRGSFSTPQSAVEHLVPKVTVEEAEKNGQAFRQEVKKKNGRRTTSKGTEQLFAGVVDSEEGKGVGNSIFPQRVPGNLLTESEGPFPEEEIPENAIVAEVKIGNQVFRRKELNFTPEERAALKAEKDEALRLVHEQGYIVPDDLEIITARGLPENSGGEEVDQFCYVISEQEYMTNEREYQESQLTYWENDGVLADERDVPLDIADTIGEDNLRFGEKSGQHHIVYVQNDQLKIVFEISRSIGSFAEEVQGFKSETDILEGHEIKSHNKRKRSQAS